MSERKVRQEEFRISGEQLVNKVKQLAHEGKVRRVSLRSEDGKTLIDVPLAVGVAGAAASVLWLPTLAAIAAIAALVSRVTLVVEKEA